MRVWLAFFLGGVVTYAMRASFILAWGDRTLPPWAERALRYVGPAAFAAIFGPAVVGDAGLGRVVDPDARLLAALLAGVFLAKTKSMPTTLVIGMGSLWLLQWAGL